MSSPFGIPDFFTRVLTLEGRWRPARIIGRKDVQIASRSRESSETRAPQRLARSKLPVYCGMIRFLTSSPSAFAALPVWPIACLEGPSALNILLEEIGPLIAVCCQVTILPLSSDTPVAIAPSELVRLRRRSDRGWRDDCLAGLAIDIVGGFSELG